MSRVLVTRPEPDAAAWVQALSAAGHPAEACPLICIETLPAGALPMADADALMFVSPQAVAAWWAQGRGVAEGQRCWAPGPGTARALRARGVPPSAIDEPPADALQFDSEHLWPVVQAQVVPGHRLLVVRGQSSEARPAEAGQGRDWLAQRCHAAGASVVAVAVYRRSPPRWGRDEVARAAQASHDGSRWLFSSSQALAHLRQLCPHHVWSSARALVTHPRMVASAQALGFGEIIVTRPALDDVLRVLSAQP